MHTPPTPGREAAFDEYAGDYDAALNQGLSVSGEGKEFFARGRVETLAGRLRELGARPRSALDFGCGTGSSCPVLAEMLDLESVVGIDPSARSIEEARRLHGGESTRFFTTEQLPGGLLFDLAFCNGVFHHIPPPERAAAVARVRDALRPGGLFSFWENNPWNPGTRYVMSRIPFDRDAITLTPPEARRMLEAGGFEVLRTESRFLFPRSLAFLRPAERLVAGLPVGAQYHILVRKPDAPG